MKLLWRISCVLSSVIAILWIFPLVGAGKYHPEAFLTTEQKVKRHGYPIEVYQITTQDDYLLPLYRVPHGIYNKNRDNKNKSVVVLLHGMGGCPDNYLLFGKDSLPYFFAERDFDVFLFSSRGTPSPFKRNHKRWDWNEDLDYWVYSNHEIAIYDLKAAIDLILEITGQEKVFLLGHSAGGTEIYILLSELPEYNEKIKIGVSWGNAPILRRLDLPIVLFVCSLGDVLKGLVKYLGLTETNPIADYLKPAIMAMCSDPSYVKACIKASWFIGSHRSYIQRDDDIGLIISLAPPRVAVNQAMHYMDNFNSGRFQKYDFGPKENMKLYGQKIPPLYNLSAVTAPIAFFYGQQDSFFVDGDYYESAELLPNVVLIHKISYDLYTHSDFILARNSTEMAYEPTYKLFKDYDDGILPPKVKVPDNYI